MDFNLECAFCLFGFVWDYPSLFSSSIKRDLPKSGMENLLEAKSEMKPADIIGAGITGLTGVFDVERGWDKLGLP
jgi:hypothetical protein